MDCYVRDDVLAHRTGIYIVDILDIIRQSRDCLVKSGLL